MRTRHVVAGLAAGLWLSAAGCTDAPHFGTAPDGLPIGRSPDAVIVIRCTVDNPTGLPLPGTVVEYSPEFDLLGAFSVGPDANGVYTVRVPASWQRVELRAHTADGHWHSPLLVQSVEGPDDVLYVSLTLHAD
jgi:hypothetical protein